MSYALSYITTFQEYMFQCNCLYLANFTQMTCDSVSRNLWWVARGCKGLYMLRNVLIYVCVGHSLLNCCQGISLVTLNPTADPHLLKTSMQCGTCNTSTEPTGMIFYKSFSLWYQASNYRHNMSHTIKTVTWFVLNNNLKHRSAVHQYTKLWPIQCQTVSQCCVNDHQ